MTDPLPTDGLLLSSQLTMPLYASPAMRALLTDRARLQRMLDFEAALARAEAAVGAIPATVMSEIGEACKAERYNISLLVEASIPTGNFATAVGGRGRSLRSSPGPPGSTPFRPGSRTQI